MAVEKGPELAGVCTENFVRCPEGCPAMGAGSREPSWVGLRATLLLRAPFGKQADVREVPSGTSAQTAACRVPESLLIIHNTQRDNLRNFQNYG